MIALLMCLHETKKRNLRWSRFRFLPPNLGDQGGQIDQAPGDSWCRVVAEPNQPGPGPGPIRSPKRGDPAPRRPHQRGRWHPHRAAAQFPSAPHGPGRPLPSQAGASLVRSGPEPAGLWAASGLFSFNRKNPPADGLWRRRDPAAGVCAAPRQCLRGGSQTCGFARLLCNAAVPPWAGFQRETSPVLSREYAACGGCERELSVRAPRLGAGRQRESRKPLAGIKRLFRAVVLVRGGWERSSLTSPRHHLKGKEELRLRECPRLVRTIAAAMPRALRLAALEQSSRLEAASALGAARVLLSQVTQGHGHVASCATEGGRAVPRDTWQVLGSWSCSPCGHGSPRGARAR